MAKTKRWIDLRHPFIFGSEAYWIICPGCGGYHVFTIGFKDEAERQKHIQNRSDKKEHVWTFNGDLDQPTFAPSMLYSSGGWKGEPLKVCHSYVRNGRIEFLNDCTHGLKGQTVDLPQIKEKELDED